MKPDDPSFRYRVLPVTFSRILAVSFYLIVAQLIVGTLAGLILGVIGGGSALVLDEATATVQIGMIAVFAAVTVLLPVWAVIAWGRYGGTRLAFVRRHPLDTAKAKGLYPPR